MSRLVSSAIFAFGLYASSALAAAAPIPEPIAVAVEPPDGGLDRADAAPSVPSAESHATSGIAAPSAADPSKADAEKAPKLADGQRGIALKIMPFGWQIGLIGH
jgi:hypothetical protein